MVKRLNIEKMQRLLDQDKERMAKQEQSTKTVAEDFTKDMKITDHFIDRAQERFGVKNFHDAARNYAYVMSWVTDLLKNYDDFAVSDNDQNNLLITCGAVIIIYDQEKRTCVTCYPLTYNRYAKEYDSLETAVLKASYQLDDFDRNYITSVFINRYYQDVNTYAQELSNLHQELADLYAEQAKSKQQLFLDAKQEIITQKLSLIHAIEDKLNNIHRVAFNIKYKSKD
ncbi:hypothetical protein PT287_04995 [Lactobacillus sp. ESL0679]|uniref:hypothetical protein n=1 Tax=Lactobacillus sp. ESL0679 TaxID=2983209 RepID=UPI0023F8E45C|nr:hypothetical protein [Lactobacillus sp. ESL0679]MDF7682881.1 hypothetical protein [Lactobacillus sp. ESL0679]